MKTTFAATCLVIGSLMIPVAAMAAEQVERHEDRAHPMTWVKDSMITTAIKAKLATDHPGSLKHIRVDTDADGVVWLTGTANNQAEIDQAISVARNTENVKSVWADLKIENDR